ncbi:TonB-dependent receptor [Pseudomaricurvus alkylphenolicus]|uniref:TonB-dependent receptor n=1 Tax=Pseudomaricurvus alkylphenolicus TaxID=1306991 RepID=UPI0014236F2F|nr:TonB-dependent receptor [Pseudomaricurvus alkylphenolicus]NIB41005.1 TonB-dependent receptor [Pseudomaricurvus alkylphenolicus]
MIPYSRRLLATLVCMSATSMTQAAVLEEVLVTAQKRAQDLQDVPVAISAFNAEALEHQGIGDIEDVSQYVPNVQIAESPAGSTSATISIRGSVTINPAVTWEPTVGIYLDGVFIGKNVGGIFDVAELERIEVLRGPQGTLYGKNTVGGAINLITRQPSEELSGKIDVGIGNYGARKLGASITGSIIEDRVSASLSYLKQDRDGFDDNPATGDKYKELDSEAGRFSVLANLTDNLELQYSFDWSEKNNTPSMPQATPQPVYERLDNAGANGAIYDRSTGEGHALHVTADFGDLTIKSITAYREMSFDDTFDFDATALTFFHTVREVEHEQLSQEFQFVGSIGDLDYVAGLFYFQEQADANNPYIFPGPFVVSNTYGVDATSYAAYGQVEYQVTEALTLTAGLRWTEEEKEFYVEHLGFRLPGDPVYSSKSSDTWSNVSPAFVASYQWSEEVNTYLKVAQGWKSGGFNGEAENATVASTPYDGETVTTYELGLKSRLFDNRIQLNAALFQNNTEDLQLNEFLGFYGYSQTTNAGETSVNGFELEIVAAITDSLTFNANYGYLDAEYDEFVLYGTDAKDTALFPYSPETTYSLGVNYNTPLPVGELNLRLDYSYVDDHVLYFDAPSAALTAVDDYSLLNARLTWSDIKVGETGAFKLSIWGKNLTDEDYYINGVPNVQAGVGVNYLGNPRTYGLDIAYQF